MSKVQRLKVFLAALCVSALALDSALAQDPAPTPQSETAVSPDAQDASQPGWLLRGRNQQNRIVNPFRATPAPGAARGPKSNPQPATRLGPNVPLPPSTVAPVDAAAPANRERMSTPGSSASCAAMNSLATRFMPSRKGVTSAARAERNSPARTLRLYALFT